MYYVYAHINPVNLKIFYIGKGTGERYISKLGRNKFWNNTVNKYGFSAIKLVDGLTENEAFEIEKIYIEKYKLRIDGGTLVNLTKGGSGGNTINEINRETFLKKCSETKLGNKNPNYGKSSTFKGKHHTELTKQKLRELKLGKKLKPDVKEKVLLGLKKAAEVKLKNSLQVECLNTGKKWQNRQSCIADLGITLATFKRWIFINRPVQKGHYLKYIKN